jgi:hypothetical protein
VSLSLQSMLVLNVVGTADYCMHVHAAGPGRTYKLLLASLSGADDHKKQCKMLELLLRLKYRPVWCTHLQCVEFF